MVEDCRNCLCPNDIVKDELAQELTIEQAIQDNDNERKRLIADLEKAGVTFPVTELETLASKRLIGNDPIKPEGEKGCRQAPLGASGEAMSNTASTLGEYAINLPDDLKELLRRYYELEAESENLKQGVPMAATNSSFNDEENQTESLAKVETPRAPFCFFRRRSVAIVENETNRFYEAQERSGRSRHVWIPGKEGDDTSHNSSRVTVIYPKERTRKIRLGLFVSCFVLMGLIAAIVFYANQHNESENSTAKALPVGEESNEPSQSPSPTSKVTPSPTMVKCVDEVVVSKGCFEVGEPVGALFMNCDPLPDDWLAVYAAGNSSSVLSDNSIAWMYTCGNKQCRGVVQSSFYAFQIFEAGSYRIHLIRNREDEQYKPYASTVEFDVMQNRLDCPTEVNSGVVSGVSLEATPENP